MRLIFMHCCTWLAAGLSRLTSVGTPLKRFHSADRKRLTRQVFRLSKIYI